MRRAQNREPGMGRTPFAGLRGCGGGGGNVKAREELTASGRGGARSGAGAGSWSRAGRRRSRRRAGPTSSWRGSVGGWGATRMVDKGRFTRAREREGGGRERRRGARERTGLYIYGALWNRRYDSTALGTRRPLETAHAAERGQPAHRSPPRAPTACTCAPRASA